jgi:L-asparaginase
MVGFADHVSDTLQAHAGRTLPRFDVLELEKPIDSANLHPSTWRGMADALLEHWDAYDGFVILHGTDTLAWSASALSFMLRGTNKPVILTGSQIPLIQARSDALANLEASLLLAARQPIPEVGVFFGRQLFRGNRCTKRSSNRFDAFDSPNYPPLAQVGIDMIVNNDHILPATKRQFVVPEMDNDAVAVLTIHPGVSARMLEALVSGDRTRGLILRSYGAGNVPDIDRELMAALERLIARGLVVVNITQCLSGGVAQGTYQTSAMLSRMGVVPGADMTLEAAFAKLHFLLATEHDQGTVRSMAGTSLCGELTPSID